MYGVVYSTYFLDDGWWLMEDLRLRVMKAACAMARMKRKRPRWCHCNMQYGVINRCPNFVLDSGSAGKWILMINYWRYSTVLCTTEQWKQRGTEKGEGRQGGCRQVSDKWNNILWKNNNETIILSQGSIPAIPSPLSPTHHWYIVQ